jgi:hypothetical protein
MGDLPGIRHELKADGFTGSQGSSRLPVIIEVGRIIEACW